MIKELFYYTLNITNTYCHLKFVATTTINQYHSVSIN